MRNTEGVINPLVKQICVKCSSKIKQSNFRFQVFFHVTYDKNGYIVADVKEIYL